MAKQTDLKFKRFGHLTVIEQTDDYISPSGQHDTRWICKCDCGNTKIFRRVELCNNGRQSCGCIRKQQFAINQFEHILPLDKLKHLYIEEKWSLRQLQEVFHIQRPVIKEKLMQAGIEIRGAHDIEYYKRRRKYEEWQTGSRDYNKIMENHIGRPLTDSEVIHHIDKNRLNNTIENLFLFPNQALHNAYHGYLRNHQYITPFDFLQLHAKTYKRIKSCEYLYDQYINRRKSVAQIARENYPVNRQTIANTLKDYGIFDLREKSANQFDCN